MSIMSLSDIDQNFLNCIAYLHSSDTLAIGDRIPLQIILEDAIKVKTGFDKDFTHVVSSYLKPQQQRITSIKMDAVAIEESKQSNSDNELELDLWKEDLMCIICNEMDVGARNRLLECSGCHALYHQECHKPVVTLEDASETWICQQCKDMKRKHASAGSSSSKSSSHKSSSSSKSYEKCK